MKNIAVVGMSSFDNIGDIMLCDSVKYLVKRADAEVNVFTVDMYPIYHERVRHNWTYQCLYRIYRNVRKKFPRSMLCYLCGSLALKKLLNIVKFEDQLRKADAMIVACGMVKFKTQDLDFIYEIILKISAKYRIPVMLDAVGVEKYDDRYVRAKYLRKALRSPWLKMITTREGNHGLNELKNGYQIASHIDIRAVGDPAFWIDECYGIQRKQNTETIGIGIIRPSIFEDYGKNTSSHKLWNIYKELLKKLEEEHLDWRIFSNGLVSDHVQAEKLLEELSISKDKLLPRPTNGPELLEQISGFKVVMGARLHACICAYALGIPSVGFIWYDKILHHEESIHNEKNFLKEEELTADNLLRVIKNAMKVTQPYDTNDRSAWKNKTLQSICDFLQTI
jgi:polysaccharide pyruvyl transferase WcaK-like protein